MPVEEEDNHGNQNTTLLADLTIKEEPVATDFQPSSPQKEQSPPSKATANSQSLGAIGASDKMNETSAVDKPLPRRRSERKRNNVGNNVVESGESPASTNSIRYRMCVSENISYM